MTTKVILEIRESQDLAEDFEGEGGGGEGDDKK